MKMQNPLFAPMTGKASAPHTETLIIIVTSKHPLQVKKALVKEGDNIEEHDVILEFEKQQ